MIKIALCALAVLALSCSPINRAEAKRSVPLWMRFEHFAEETAWCGIFYDSETVEEPELDEAEVEMLACVIYCEAGADSISDDTRRMVGDVVLNRVKDSRFPDSIEAVLTQRAQYGRFHWTGVVWPSRASQDSEQHAVDRAYRIARELLSGEHSALYGEGYIYQAEFKQGSGSIESDGIYFGR